MYTKYIYLYITVNILIYNIYIFINNHSFHRDVMNIHIFVLQIKVFMCVHHAG